MMTMCRRDSWIAGSPACQVLARAYLAEERPPSGRYRRSVTALPMRCSTGPRMEGRPGRMFHELKTTTMSLSGMTIGACPPKPDPAQYRRVESRGLG